MNHRQVFLSKFIISISFPRKEFPSLRRVFRVRSQRHSSPLSGHLRDLHWWHFLGEETARLSRRFCFQAPRWMPRAFSDHLPSCAFLQPLPCFPARRAWPGIRQDKVSVVGYIENRSSVIPYGIFQDLLRCDIQMVCRLI